MAHRVGGTHTREPWRGSEPALRVLPSARAWHGVRVCADMAQRVCAGVLYRSRRTPPPFPAPPERGWFEDARSSDLVVEESG